MPLIQVYKSIRAFKARRQRRPAWQTVLPNTKEGRDAYAIATKYENRFRNGFLKAMAELLTPAIKKDFLIAYETNSVATLMEVLPFFTEHESMPPDAWQGFIDTLENTYTKVLQESGDEATELLNENFDLNMKFTLDDFEEPNPVEVLKAAVDFKIQMVPVNPYSMDWMRNRSLQLIVEGISKPQLEVVQDTLSQGFDDGDRAEYIYAEIEGNIGLTEREYTAVENRRQLHLASGLSGDKANSLTDVYKKQLLHKRAERIARTETIAAQAAGRQAAWQSAQDAGILPEVERVWMAPPDACYICASLDGKTAPLGGEYESIKGPIQGPVAHPHCECTEGLRRKGT